MGKKKRVKVKKSSKYAPVVKKNKRKARIAKRKKRARTIKRFIRNVLSVIAVVLGIIYFVMPRLYDAIPKDLAGPFSVVRAVDGDTIIVKLPEGEQTVRLIGVDTPESVHPDEWKNVPEGKTASDYTKKLLKGQKVYLEFDAEREDQYGRLLAYVYLDDGKTMVQELLLSDGMAQVMTIQPNSRYSFRFSVLQQEARLKRAGFWAAAVF